MYRTIFRGKAALLCVNLLFLEGVFLTTSLTPQSAQAQVPSNVTGYNINSFTYKNRSGGLVVTISQRQTEEGKNVASKEWVSGVSRYTEAKRDQNTLVLNAARFGIVVTVDLQQKTVKMSHQTRIDYILVSATAATKAKAPTARMALIQRDLGSGYDATGVYADEKNRKARIFNLSDGSGYTMQEYSGTGLIEAHAGSNATDFSNSLSVSAGLGVNTGLFSASVKASYGSARISTALTAFAQVDDRWWVCKAKLKPTATILPEALQELRTLAAPAAVRKYGTHYLNAIDYGGRLVWSSYARNQSNLTKQQIAVEAKASYRIVSGEVAVDTQSSLFTQRMRSNATLLCYGGNGAVNLENARDQGVYQGWKQSINDNPTIIGFGAPTDRGLRGIWTIPGLSATRVQALQNAVNEYIKRQGASVFRPARSQQ
jgi:hypothetical protein